MNDGHNLLQGGGDWTNVIIPGNAQNSGFNHKNTYEVSNLLTDAEYECLVQARNQFGWSEASRIFHFYTGGFSLLGFLVVDIVADLIVHQLLDLIQSSNECSNPIPSHLSADGPNNLHTVFLGTDGAGLHLDLLAVPLYGGCAHLKRCGV